MYESTPLVEAASENDFPRVEALLRQGYSLEEKASFETTALIAACMKGHVKMARFLLRRGAKLEACNENGNTPLIFACTFGYFELAVELVQHGASFQAKNAFGRTPLVIAVSLGHLHIAKYLVKKGANLQEKGPKDQSLLMLAAASGRLPVVEWLVERGCSLAETTPQGDTALSLATAHRHLPVVEFITRRLNNTKEKKAKKIKAAKKTEPVDVLPDLNPLSSGKTSSLSSPQSTAQSLPPITLDNKIISSLTPENNAPKNKKPNTSKKHQHKKRFLTTIAPLVVPNTNLTVTETISVQETTDLSKSDPSFALNPRDTAQNSILTSHPRREKTSIKSLNTKKTQHSQPPALHQTFSQAVAGPAAIDKKAQTPSLSTPITLFSNEGQPGIRRNNSQLPVPEYLRVAFWSRFFSEPRPRHLSLQRADSFPPFNGTITQKDKVQELLKDNAFNTDLAVLRATYRR